MAEFKVEVVSRKYISGNKPVYAVTAPDGTHYFCESKWGVRRVIRMYRRAAQMQAKANQTEEKEWL